MHTNTDNFLILGRYPDRFARCYQEILYYSDAYWQSQPQAPNHSFFLTFPEGRQILAEIHFHSEGTQATSQLFAPFGSFVSGPVSMEVARSFVAAICKSLENKGLHRISIHHPSSCYNPNPIWEDLLLEFGFIGQSAINHHLQVDKRPLSENLHYMEKRKLAKSSNFVFRVLPQDQLKVIYDFIHDCRKQKKQRLSLCYQRLERIVQHNRDHFVLCAVYDGMMLAAASIIIKVNSACWYHFYPAHHPLYDKQSPMVFLTAELYRYAHQQGVEVIDLGTSELDRQPLEGLLTFKSRLGGIQTLKTVYSKLLKN